MIRTTEVHYRENGEARFVTVRHNESLLAVFDDLKKRNAVVLKIDPRWS